MTLTAHMAIAAAVAKPFARAHPVLGFFAALASHYFADAIPHWDYPLCAMQGRDDGEKQNWNASKARAFRRVIIRDIRNCAIDATLGAALVILFIKPHSQAQWLWAIIAVIGGALPDFLQGLYLSGLSLLKPIQKFHDRIHTKIKLGAYPRIGIPFQLLILCATVLFI